MEHFMNPTAENADRMHGSVDRISRTAHQAVDRMAEKVAPALDQARSAAERATDMVGSKIDDFSEMQDEWMESMRDQVRNRPLAVVGIAVLAGLILGRMMR
jgi:ElaB/YqjD/DUF883 family membrane-anchored ribosome-binding protein